MITINPKKRHFDAAHQMIENSHAFLDLPKSRAIITEEQIPAGLIFLDDISKKYGPYELRHNNEFFEHFVRTYREKGIVFRDAEHLYQGRDDGIIMRLADAVENENKDRKWVLHVRPNRIQKFLPRFAPALSVHYQAFYNAYDEVLQVTAAIDEILGSSYQILPSFNNTIAFDECVIRDLKYDIIEGRITLTVLHGDRNWITVVIYNSHEGLEDHCGNPLSIQPDKLLIFFGKEAGWATGSKNWEGTGGKLKPFLHKVSHLKELGNYQRRALILFTKLFSPKLRRIKSKLYIDRAKGKGNNDLADMLIKESLKAPGIYC